MTRSTPHGDSMGAGHRPEMPPVRRDAEAWFRRANASFQQKDYDAALAGYRAALALCPEIPELHFNLGNTLLALQSWDDAIGCYRRSLALAPDYADAHFNLGIACLDRGSIEEAIACFRRTTDLAPDRADALYNLGLALQESGRLDDAIECYRRATAVRPDFAEAHNNLGHALQSTGNLEAAAEAFGRAILHRPDYADAHYNLGSLHHLRYRYPEAIASYGNALRLRPDHYKACNNTGKAFQDLGRIEQALEWYRKALDLKPDYAEARFNLSTAQLLNGNLEEGWANYEARWAAADWRQRYPRRLAKPRWEGEELGGRTILVHSEQGLGDMLQFARYLPMVKACGGRVVFETRAALIELFRGWACLDEVVPITPPDAELRLDFDVYAPLLSLPRIFRTGPGSIPRSVPYLAADAARISQWSRRIDGDGLRVGLVWAGTSTDPRRATPLAWFAPWSSIPGVRIFGLQKGPAADLLEREGPPAGMAIDNLGPEFKDFGETAAAVSLLDLVVSIDTSVAHLAGAMGTPVYLLLPDVPDWRWLLERTDSPWYPTMRLFRQERPGAWGSPMTEAARRIDTLARSLNLARSVSGTAGLLAAAAHFHKLGDAVEASVFYQRLLREHPGHPDGLHGLGVLAHQAGNHAHAVDLLSKATALSPAVDRYHYHLGLAHAALGFHDAAEQAFARAHLLNPAWEDARENRERALRRAQR